MNGYRPRVHIANVTGVNHLWKTVAFPAGYEGSVVIAGPPSFNDTQPGVVRLKRLNKQNFQLHFKEWNYLPNAAHGSEEASVLIMKKGRYNMPDGKIWEVGSFPLSACFKSLGHQFSSRPSIKFIIAI